MFQKHIEININKTRVVGVPHQVYILLLYFRIEFLLELLDEMLVMRVDAVDGEGLGWFAVFEDFGYFVGEFGLEHGGVAWVWDEEDVGLVV